MSELNDYVKKARASGMSDDKIKVELNEAGWNKTDISKALGNKKPQKKQTLKGKAKSAKSSLRKGQHKVRKASLQKAKAKSKVNGFKRMMRKIKRIFGK